MKILLIQKSLSTKLLYKYKHIFFLKTGNLILNWVLLLFSYNHPMPEKLSSQSFLPNSLVDWEQFGSTNQAYVKKKQFSISFP